MSKNKTMLCAVLFGLVSLAIPLSACSTKVSDQAAISASALTKVLLDAGDAYATGGMGVIPNPTIVAQIKILGATATKYSDELDEAGKNNTVLPTSEKLAALAAVSALDKYLANQHITAEAHTNITTGN